MKYTAVLRKSPIPAVAAVLLLLPGCFSREAPAPPPGPYSAEEAVAPLMEEWKNLPDDAKLMERFTLVSRMVLHGPDALNPMFDIIEDSAADPQEKLHIMQSVMSFMMPAHFDRLRELTTSEDTTTRSIAAQLIGYTQHPDAAEALKALNEDPAARVRFAALAGRVVWGDQSARKDFMAIYHLPDTPHLQREEIVRLILSRWNPEEIDILMDAVTQPWLSSDLRPHVASTLGDNGVREAIEPLRKSLEVEDDPEYHESVELIITALAEIEADSPE